MTRSITYVSSQTYLKQERLREDKWEYEDGKLIPMGGATKEHNRIVRNLVTLLWNILSKKTENFEVYPNDLRVFCPNLQKYYYPDLIITKGKEEYVDKTFDTLANPYILVEVLSKSTNERDRSTKFEAYRSIPSFVEYILVDQYNFRIEAFYKNEKSEWIIKEPLTHKDDVYIFTHIDLSLKLEDIYSRIQFHTGESEERSGEF